MKNRVYFWDNYKGILIFLVVFGHFIYDYVNKMPDSFMQDIYVFIYSFHMPAFIFCSGYFSKSENSRSQKSLIKLLLYYLVFNTLMAFFAYFYLGTEFKFLTPYYSYWYILSLIIWRILIKPLSKIKYLLPIFFAVTLLIGYSREFTNVLSIRRTFAFFIFFVAGYLLDRQKTEAFLIRRKPWHLAVCTVAALLAVVAIFSVTKHFEITGSMTMMSAYGKKSNLLHRLLIIGISSVAIIGMFFTVPNKNIPLLSKIGRNSLLIYLGHRFITIVYYKAIFPYSDYNKWYLVYALIAALITCIVLSSDVLNRAIVAVFDWATLALYDQQSISGSYIITTIALLFLAMLCVTAIPEITVLFENMLSAIGH